MRLSSRQDFATEMARGTATFIRMHQVFPEAWSRTVRNLDEQNFTKDLHTAMGYRPDQPEY